MLRAIAQVLWEYVMSVQWPTEEIDDAVHYLVEFLQSEHAKHSTQSGFNLRANYAFKKFTVTKNLQWH